MAFVFIYRFSMYFLKIFSHSLNHHLLSYLVVHLENIYLCAVSLCPFLRWLLWVRESRSLGTYGVYNLAKLTDNNKNNSNNNIFSYLLNVYYLPDTVLSDVIS